MALNTEAGRSGGKAMEETMTRASRVRTQIKVGRPIAKARQWDSFQALAKIGERSDCARELMREAGLNANDVRAALVIRTHSGILWKVLPALGETAGFFETVSKIDEGFLGILWEQTDREAEDQGLPGKYLWITAFATEPEAQQMLSVLKSYIAVNGKRLPQ